MPRRRRSESAQQTPAQLAALIPAGRVNARQAHRVEIEQVAVGDRGAVLVTREIVSTPVRWLFRSGCITQTEVAAAQKFYEDFASSYLRSKNVLGGVQVDAKGGGGDIHQAMIYRVNKAMQNRETEQALDFDALRILRELVLQESESGGEGTFTSLGRDMSPFASERTQRDMARGAAWLALRQLARVYERGGKRRVSALTQAGSRL